ncbi:MAG: endonuclease Q family protein, partial [Candidatus Woesearchaeota archaeon]|nr:endonuclease Q family protein [Candidatus Woesearchaeota archaeon]
MNIIADLHMHSRFSRACSNAITIKNLAQYSKIKGLTLLGTSDAQHPKWIEELKTELHDEHGTGIYTAHDQNFMCTTEISLAYSWDGKGRRVHHVVLLPNLHAVKGLQEALLKRGRIDYDGRPIFGMTSPEFVELVRGVDERCEIIPAHVWTPYFGMFGSKSGFNTLKDCFQDTTKHIHAIETGISSDPPMNWRLKQLDKIQIVSFSDSHSHWPWRIGREATQFDIKELTYESIVQAIRTGKGLASTIEFFPEEGRYHFDGHKNCGVLFSPKESAQHKNLCPKCKRPLTIGVLNRVEELATRPEGELPPNPKPHVKLMPLSELIVAGIGSPVASKKVWEIFNKLIAKFGTEYAVSLNTTPEQLTGIISQPIIDLMQQNKNQTLQFQPGYDGEYGHLLINGKPVGVKHRVKAEETTPNQSAPPKANLHKKKPV